VADLKRQGEKKKKREKQRESFQNTGKKNDFERGTKKSDFPCP
jgi:hypothetical protein